MFPCGLTSELTVRELKQQGRRRLRKRHLKSEQALLQASSCLLCLAQFVKCCQTFLILNGLHNRSSGKEEESHCLVFTFSKKVKLNSFTSQSCNDCKEMYKKKRNARPKQPAQQAFPVELQRESWSGSQKKGRGRGRGEEETFSPLPLPRHSSFFRSCPNVRDELARKRLLRRLRPKLLFCQSKSIAFLPFSLPSPPLLLKLPTVTCLKTDRTNRQTGRACCPPISSCKAFHSKKKMFLYVVGQNKIQVHILLIYSYMCVLHFLCFLTNIQIQPRLKAKRPFIYFYLPKT